MLNEKRKKKRKINELNVGYLYFFFHNPLILDKLPLVQSKAILAAGTSKAEREKEGIIIHLTCFYLLYHKPNILHYQPMYRPFRGTELHIFVI